MIRKLLFLSSFIFFSVMLHAQCTTGDATSCVCNGGGANCDLLPDIIAADEPLLASGTYGVIEYSQSGNGSNDGRLRISVSTPSIGHGPLQLEATTIYVCGSDTFYGSAPATCADGSFPKILINQRFYHKSGNTMTSYTHAAGTMTYHPTHGHMHVDNWGYYTLRYNNGDPNPKNWPLVGDGAKLAFCVEDYGTCNFYNGHCEDENGNVLTSANIPNYGLGGGGYNCSPTIQGITVGYTDIYYQYLDGMWITIPPGTCNGQYYIVVHVDPNNNFIEENESNNVIAIPYTLTLQTPPGNPTASITALTNTTVCAGDPVTLHADQWGTDFLWSNGATTRDITITDPGDYTVMLTNTCGTATSSAVTVSTLANDPPSTTNATVCSGEDASLNATGSGTLNWYDAAAGGNLLNTGTNYNVNNVTSPATYYVENVNSIPGANWYNTPHDNTIGTGAYHNVDSRYLTFTVSEPLTLVSVKVFTNSAGDRTVVLRNANGNDLQSVTANVPDGESRITLNMHINPGSYRLGTAAGSTINMWRNDGGVSYAYDVNGALSITGSSAGSAYYYFYYDWEVVVDPTICTSTRTPSTISLQTTCLPPASGTVVLLNPYKVNISHDAACNAIKYKIRYRPTGTTTWAMKSSSNLAVNISGLLPATEYMYQVRTRCNSGNSSWTSPDTFTTSPLKSNPELFRKEVLNVYPNPSAGDFIVELNNVNPDEVVTIEVINQIGQKVYEQVIRSADESMQTYIHLNTVAGMYFVKVSNGNNEWTKSVVIE